MLFLSTIPFIIFYTFKNLIEGNWLSIEGGMKNANFLEWAFTVFVGLFLSLLISLVPIFISKFIGSLPKTQGKVYMKYDLVSLKEKDGIKGRSYFLGIGSIDDVQYYFWYRKNKGGFISGGKTQRCEGVRIFERNETPKMIVYEDEYKNKYIKYWIWLFGIKNKSDALYYPDFIIPENSIKNNYSL